MHQPVGVRSISHAIAIVLFVGCQSPLRAQRPVTPYISAGGGLTLEQGHILQAGGGSVFDLGGTALSGNVAAGIRIVQRASVGVEASFGRPTSQSVSTRSGLLGPYTRYDRTNDSRIVSGVGGVRVWNGLWVVGGMGLLRSTTSAIVRNATIGRVERAYHWTNAAGVFGVDYRWVADNHFAIVPSVRAYLSKRDADDERDRIGLGPLVFRPSLVVEVGF